MTTADSCTSCLHYWVCGFDSCREVGKTCLAFLKSSDYKRLVYARWIVPDDNYPYTCTNCLYEYVIDSDEEYKPSKYCPECGAFMMLGDFK